MGGTISPSLGYAGHRDDENNERLGERNSKVIEDEEALLSDQDVLDREEESLRLFLTQVRPVGEEKSELYPEPQYFTLGFTGGTVVLPYLIDIIKDRAGGARQFAQQTKKILSPASAVHLSGLLFMATWGREMTLLEPSMPRGRGSSVFDEGELGLTDKDVAETMRFARLVTRYRREDGQVYPAEDRALGQDYRILPAEEANRIAAGTTPVDRDQAQALLALMASVRSLSFLMEAETREALMVHGPYPASEPSDQLIIFECSDLHWSFFPEYPLPDGARWALPPEPFPVANLAIALVVRDAMIEADRFGTLYVDPLNASNIVSASLFTRGSDFFVDAGLSEIPLSEARALSRRCDEIQEFMFLQIAMWDPLQRLAAGVFDEQAFFLRLMAGAGLGRAELEALQQTIMQRCAQVTAPIYDDVARRTTDQLPFFAKLGRFVGGEIPRLFTPFRT